MLEILLGRVTVGVIVLNLIVYILNMMGGISDFVSLYIVKGSVIILIINTVFYALIYFRYLVRYNKGSKK